MAGVDNLIPLPNRTKEEQKQIQSAGGKASQEKQRRLKSAAEVLRYYMNLKNIDHPELTNLEVMELHLANAAVKINQFGNPNLKAIDMVHAMLGEKKEEQQRTADQIIKYVSDAQFKEVNAHIDSVVGDTDDRPKHEPILE